MKKSNAEWRVVTRTASGCKSEGREGVIKMYMRTGVCEKLDDTSCEIASIVGLTRPSSESEWGLRPSRETTLKKVFANFGGLIRRSVATARNAVRRDDETERNGD